jgi:hypothetical protein
MNDRMPIITLWQPWCKWIALGWKTIETRLHNRFKKLKGQRIGIHVGKKWDKNAFIIAANYLTNNQINHTKFLKNSGGYIICTAFVSDFRECKKEDSLKALIDCENIKRFGLFLSDIQRLDEPLLNIYRGHQGIWYL